MSQEDSQRPVDYTVERALVLRSQDGDAEAFEELVNRYQGPLFRTAFMLIGDRQDSEDTVQEALLLSWSRLHLLEEPDAFRGWLFRICTRRASDLIRKRARRATDPHDTNETEMSHASSSLVGGTRDHVSARTADPASVTEVHAQMQALTQVLDHIDQDLRACWVLREVENMPYREIAHVLAITESTARGRITRARSQVVRRMEEWR